MLLALESSCDETAVAVFDSGRLLAHSLASQIALHAATGGIVPEVASRAHCEALPALVQQVLEEAETSSSQLTRVAVTVAPGLIGPLLVGTSYARSLAWSLGVEVMGVHHLEGHVFAPWVESGDPEFPFIALCVSGGHTELYRVDRPGRYARLGRTRDDAAGEAFDKVSRLLQLGYPGGPAIEEASQGGDAGRWHFAGGLEGRGLDFSFSGLKSAVGRHVEEHGVPEGQGRADLCASVQTTICRVLINKSLSALAEEGLKRLVVTGGVAANTALREGMEARCSASGVKLVLPRRKWCTDNAAMIGRAALLLVAEGAPEMEASAQATLRLDRARR